MCNTGDRNLSTLVQSRRNPWVSPGVSVSDLNLKFGRSLRFPARFLLRFRLPRLRPADGRIDQRAPHDDQTQRREKERCSHRPFSQALVVPGSLEPIVHPEPERVDGGVESRCPGAERTRRCRRPIQQVTKVLDLQARVCRSRKLNAAADHPTGVRFGKSEDSRISRYRRIVVDIGPTPTGRHINQRSRVQRSGADTATHRCHPVNLVAAFEGGIRAGRPPVDIRPRAVRFNAQDDSSSLPVETNLTTAQHAAPGVVGGGRGSIGVLPVNVGRAYTHMPTDIEARPRERTLRSQIATGPGARAKQHRGARG